MKTDKAALVLACIAVVIGIGSTNGPVKEMIAGLKPQADAAVMSYAQNQAEDDLRAQITRRAEALNAQPVNAVVDRVWKAIPGYNGLEVDVEATYRSALCGDPKQVSSCCTARLSLRYHWMIWERSRFTGESGEADGLADD